MKKVLKFLSIVSLLASFVFIVSALKATSERHMSSQEGPPVVSQSGFVVKVVTDFPMHKEASTGALIRNDLVLTCYHTLQGRSRAGETTVEFLDGYTSKAEVIKTDPLRDLALLRIKPVLYPCAKAALIPAKKGDTITVCGFPFGRGYAEVTGELVGFRTNRQYGPNEVFLVNNKSFIGMAGSPALDARGDMVGSLFGSFTYSSCTGLDAIKDFLSDPKELDLAP